MRKLVPFAIAAALAAPVASAADRFDFDKAHTDILFFIDHLGFSTLSGEFKSYSGTINIDQADLTKSSVDVSIDAASIDMDDEKLNEHLRNADFFDVANHKALTFKSTAVTKVDDKHLKVAGDLTIRGITKPVTLDVTINKIGPHPFDKTKTKAGFSATATINRSDFDVKYASPAVGESVKIQINTELQKAG